VEKLYFLSKINRLLGLVASAMVGLLLSQIIFNYLEYSVKIPTPVEQKNILINSYAQINAKDNNFYIKSDLVEILEEEIIFRNNIMESNVGNGVGDIVIYNRATEDILLKNRPRFTFEEF
jgi:hypothetical protein